MTVVWALLLGRVLQIIDGMSKSKDVVHGC